MKFKTKLVPWDPTVKGSRHAVHYFVNGKEVNRDDFLAILQLVRSK